MNRPAVKAIVYGHTGSWKSSFLKTFPKPMLVWFFDAHGKDFPFWRDGWHNVLPEEAVGPLQAYQIEGSPVMIPYRDIQHPDGLVRLEYYHDLDPERPNAFYNWKLRRVRFAQEWSFWATVGLDSFTSCETAARLHEKYVLNPQTDKEYKSRDPRKWWGGSTDSMEEALKVSFLSYPMNVVVTAHVDVDRDESAVAGTSVRNPMAPGRLRGSLAQQYMELYYAYVLTDPKTGQRTGQLQTRSNGLYNASSQIDAPDPCFPHYESLWANFDGARGGDGA